jgi:hypothetical protein
MASACDVLHVAAAEVGYYAPDDPEPGSKYGRWLAEKWDEDWLAGSSREIAWCCLFVSWCLDQAGQECTGFPSYNTDLVLGKGPNLVDARDCQPGDIMIWDWNGDGATDHIGFINYVNHDGSQPGYVQTVEGNHYNRVDVVDRSDCWGVLAAIIRPPYNAGLPTDSTDSVDDTVKEGEMDYLGEVAGMVIDGEFGNGLERVQRLYDAVQGTVDKIMLGNDFQEDAVWAAFANDVIRGIYGNGEDRKANIYAAVQNRVNRLLQ